MGRPPKVEERSEEIMHAFETCVLRKGLAATTLTDVAAEAGLPRSLVRYFMGNRDAMVDRLVDRMMSVGNARLEKVREQAGQMAVHLLIDAYFEDVFADPRSNAIIGELWYLARNDAHVRERLHGVYEHALLLLTDAMERDGRGSPAERQEAAFAVLSMALGQASLNDFNLTASASAMRAHARIIVDALNTQETAS